MLVGSSSQMVNCQTLNIHLEYTQHCKPLMYQFKLVGQIAVFNVGECKLIGLEATSLLHKFICST